MTDSNDQIEVPSISSDLNIQMRGFEEEYARVAGKNILSAIREISRYLPLKNLDGVTVGADYNDALASINRGFGNPSYVPEPTRDGNVAHGLGMALPVIRDGSFKTHVVFGPQIANAFSNNSDSEESIRMGLKLLAHELGHVVDHDNKQKAFDNLLCKNKEELIPDPLERYLWEIGNHIWDEYFANRVAANIIVMGDIENELFVASANDYRKKIFEDRVKYHCREMILDDFLSTVNQKLHTLLLTTGYLFGVYDVIGEDESIIEALDLLNSPKHCTLKSFHEVLLSLWENIGVWKSYDEFLALNKPTLELFEDLELYPSMLDNGSLYMDVPIL